MSSKNYEESGYGVDLDLLTYINCESHILGEVG